VLFPVRRSALHTIVFEALPVDDPQVRRPDITRARQLLAWEPQVSLRDGVMRMIDYYAGALNRLAGR
jgi:dTDP-glucose 4,6-dehydratase